jgi:hypothetical protein
MDQVPAFVSVVFMVTTFITVGIFVFAIKSAGSDSFAKRFLLFIVPFWLLLQVVVASSGFYINTASLPPRLFVFGVAPALLLIIGIFVFARPTIVTALPLTLLTIIHVIRIPVELTLAWLAEARVVPEIMTFHGTNLDILSGITAPFAFYFAIKERPSSRVVLIVWNLAALALVLNIVITAILCIPSPIQKLAFDQPNIAVLNFPYAWLPTIVVPIVFFSHFASLYKPLILRRP